MVSQCGFYVYGLVGQHPGQLDIVGIDKNHKVYPLEWKDLYVLVSKVDIEQFQKQIQDVISELTQTTDPSQHATMEVLEAHERVIDSVMRENTVVPLKFGTVLKDENAAVQMLQDHEEHFRELLSKFKGKVEWGLKAYADRQALVKHIEGTKYTQADKEKKVEKPSRGTAYLLGKKKQEELKRDILTCLARIAQEIFHAFEKDACEAKINSTSSQKGTGKEEEIILNAVYLVERERIAHFQQQREALTEKYGFVKVHLEFSGPWPPYNFT